MNYQELLREWIVEELDWMERCEWEWVEDEKMEESAILQTLG